MATTQFELSTEANKRKVCEQLTNWQQKLRELAHNNYSSSLTFETFDFPLITVKESRKKETIKSDFNQCKTVKMDKTCVIKDL